MKPPGRSYGRLEEDGGSGNGLHRNIEGMEHAKGVSCWMWKEEWGPVQLEGPFAGHSQS